MTDFVDYQGVPIEKGTPVFLVVNLHGTVSGFIDADADADSNGRPIHYPAKIVVSFPDDEDEDEVVECIYLGNDTWEAGDDLEVMPVENVEGKNV